MNKKLTVTNRTKIFSQVVLPLLTGGLIYILFRADSLLMFRWFDKLGASDLINFCRQHTFGQFSLPTWFIYSLPDALWIFSFTSLMLSIWQDKFSVQSLFWILIAPTIGLLSEIGQAFHFVRGTYDLSDLTLILIASALPFYSPVKKHQTQSL